MRGVPLVICVGVAILSGSPGVVRAQAKPNPQAKSTSALFKAIQDKDVNRVQALLDQGANPNAVNADRDSPLLAAEFADSFEIAQLLLQHGAKPEGEAVILAIRSPKLLKLVLDHGGNPNSLLPVPNPNSDMAPPKGVTALMIAAMLAQTESMTLLIEKGAKLDTQDEGGYTALTHAMTEGFLPFETRIGSRNDAVKLLLEKGAPLDRSNREGASDLAVAVESGDIEIVRMLLTHGFPVDRQGKDGTTALARAVMHLSMDRGPHVTYLAIAQLLLDQGADPAKVLKPPDGFSAAVKALLATSKRFVPPARRLAEPTPNLLELAKPIATLKMPVTSYAWQSVQQLLIMPDGKAVRTGGDLNWQQHDLATGRTGTLPSLHYAGMQMVVSPDGRWALDDYGGSDAIEFSVYPLTGAARLKRSSGRTIKDKSAGIASDTGDLVWMHDGRRWLWFPNPFHSETLHAYLYSLDSSKCLRALPVSLPKRDLPVKIEYSPHLLLGVTASGQGLFTVGEGSMFAVNQVELFTFDLEHASTAKGTVFTLPAQAVCLPVLSPVGDRIAWTLYAELNGRYTTEIWICNIDGSAMRPIGKQLSKSVREAGTLGDVRWLPDGKRLSFLYLEQIYTLPVGP